MPTHNQIIQDRNKDLNPSGLREMGAYFPIEVPVPTPIADLLTKQGTSIPSPVSGVGLIDTGATLTCIEETLLVSALRLNPIGVVNSGTANGPVRQNVYPGRIVFPTKSWSMDFGRVVGVNLTGQVIREPEPRPIVALLGRNFLERCVFIYNGTMGSWTISI